MRSKIILFIVFMQLLSTANATIHTNTFSYLYKADSIITSSVLNYSGVPTTALRGSVKNLETSGATISFSQCNSTANQWTTEYAEDRWLFVPKSISINGNSYPIEKPAIGQMITISDIGNYYAYKISVAQRYDRKYKGCHPIGFQETWMTYKYPDFEVIIKGIDRLPLGNYTGNIPVRISHAEYFLNPSIGTTVISRFSDAEGFNGAQDILLPFNISINNRCSISKNQLELEHSGSTMDKADGNTVFKDVDITCEHPTAVKLKISLKPAVTSKPTTSYTNGVGVGLGNGWDSILTVDNINISENSEPEVEVLSHKKLKINSQLKRTANSKVGSLSGSAVMELKFE